MNATTPIDEVRAADPDKPAGPIKIVIADDHPIFRDGLQKLLSVEKDFEVVAQVGDGDEVLQAVDNTTTKVIVLTASDDRNEFVQAMKLGTSGIVLKQSPTELLLKSIRRVHAGEIWLDSSTTAAVVRQLATSEDHSPIPRNGRTRERSPLSQREREIVALVSQGFKNKEMAQKMFISEQTVKNHLHNIFDKLGVSDRLELALYAIHKGLHLSGESVAR